MCNVKPPHIGDVVFNRIDAYKKLSITYRIPDDLSDIINEYVTFLNTGEGIADDYYRTEIQMILNWCFREHKLSDKQIKELRDYYQEGGIKKFG